MAEPMVVEFEGSLKEYGMEPKSSYFGSEVMVTFVKVDGFIAEDDLHKMAMRRFKVVMTEIKDW
jgi:hypothetical protein